MQAPINASVNIDDEFWYTASAIEVKKAWEEFFEVLSRHNFSGEVTEHYNYSNMQTEYRIVGTADVEVTDLVKLGNINLLEK